VIVYVLLALLNGMIIGMTRTINGQLSTGIGPFRASLWNHVVGFLFLTAALLVIGGWKFDTAHEAPLTAYVGGFIGALFVAVNSYVFPRLGAVNAVLLVISGQMISAVLIDYAKRDVAPTGLRWLGVAVVLLGVYLSRVSRLSREKGKAQ
jgi:bacterial/archaeal transporter family-2 protein